MHTRKYISAQCWRDDGFETCFTKFSPGEDLKQKNARPRKKKKNARRNDKKTEKNEGKSDIK